MTPADFATMWPDAEQRIRDHADRLLKTVVVALFANPKRPRLVGSGFFVAYKSGLYLVSARHVFAEQELLADGDSLFYYSSRDTINGISGRLLTSPGPLRKDVVDIGILQVGKSHPAWSGDARRTPVTFDAFDDLSSSDGEELFLLAGYPETKSRIDPQSGTMLAKPYGLTRRSTHHEKYVALGLDPSTHIVVDFDQRKEQRFVGRPNAQFPKPQGMSGAPLWMLKFTESGDIETRIVGLGIEHRSDDKAIVCVRAEPIMGLIQYMDAGPATA
ncbi:MAG TPA: hypothetical protein VFM48_09880 [Aquabacterium sp.]|nr:hypothetical protein [Aquabacterium sp.]